MSDPSQGPEGARGADDSSGGGSSSGETEGRAGLVIAAMFIGGMLIVVGSGILMQLIALLLMHEHERQSISREPDPALTASICATATQETDEIPFSLGDEVAIGDWNITVNSVTRHADKRVLAKATYATRPSEGEEYILVNLTITYVGEGREGGLGDGFGVSVVSSGARVDDERTRLLAPDNIHYGFVRPGENVSGNTALLAPSNQVDEGMLEINVPGICPKKALVKIS